MQRKSVFKLAKMAVQLMIVFALAVMSTSVRAANNNRGDGDRDRGRPVRIGPWMAITVLRWKAFSAFPEAAFRSVA